MATLDFETDPMLVLLTDALRAGPGSAPWRDAVARLRAGGTEQADEYLLLCNARERLASGQSYRQVHAGPGFSRRVMQGVEEAADGAGAAASSAGVIALISGLVVVAVVAVVGYVLWRGAAKPPPAVTDLSRLYFTEKLLDVSLTAPPAGWKQAGAMPLNFDAGLKPGAAAPAIEGQDFVGAALWRGEPLAPDRPVQIEVDLRLPPPESALVAQVFVTDDPTFSAARATSPSELVWSYQSGAASVVLPAGYAGAEPFRPGEKVRRVVVRIQLDARSAAVDTAGRRTWSGLHGFDPARARYVGVRFLAPAGQKIDAPAAFTSIALHTVRE